MTSLEVFHEHINNLFLKISFVDLSVVIPMCKHFYNKEV